MHMQCNYVTTVKLEFINCTVKLFYTSDPTSDCILLFGTFTVLVLPRKCQLCLIITMLTGILRIGSIYLFLIQVYIGYLIFITV